jgi:hypothetical protein
MQARRIHHHEHRGKAAARFADQPAGGIVEAHRAGRAAVQAHLFFDALAVHCVARAIGQQLGHEHQRQTLRPGRRIRQPAQHQVNDVRRQVVFAARDEDLAAAHAEAAVGLRHGARAHLAEIAARVRFGQAHGGEPFAGRDLLQVAALQFVAAVVLEAGVGAMQQARRHREPVVRGAEPFVEHGFEHRGQALAAVFRRGGERGPAAIDERLVRVAKTRRRNDFALVEVAADFIAFAIDRRHDIADEARGFVEHLRLQRLVDLAKGASACSRAGASSTAFRRKRTSSGRGR